ncbi:hypothetical protein VITU9109_04527 [Vibrio tubiashii ATCC 19109]|uniref:Transposase n=1 Tax=Vibrio tubiashii ATCC 19109 TaxID=1051646 RepID=A0ABN0D9C7_9VIBR|nr:hypothetical protein VITU9109_04527 [Vibrio tubiashii ATCC 19109]
MLTQQKSSAAALLTIVKARNLVEEVHLLFQ